VRGYEYEDSLVVVNDQDLASLPQTQEQSIVLRQCVHAHAVDPIAFDHAFYVAPAKGAKRAYALLVEVLHQTGMVALGTASLRDHERLIVLRPVREALVLHTLFAPTDMLSLERLALPHRPPQPLETRAAQEWVARLSGVYVPEQWVDRSQEALSALVARKAKASANRVPALPGHARRKSSSPLPKAAA
jgi:DNA end-binding protein Ku